MMFPQQFLERRINILKVDGSRIEGILKHIGSESISLETIDNGLVLVRDEEIHGFNTPGYRTFEKKIIGYNGGKASVVSVYRNHRCIDELMINSGVMKEEDPSSFPSMPMSQDWYAEVYYNGSVRRFDDKVRRAAFLTEKLDFGDKDRGIWEWEWQPSEYGGRLVLNWHTTFTEEDDTPILLKAPSSWGPGGNIFGLCNRELCFYDPCLSVKEHLYTPRKGYPYVAYIRYDDDPDKAMEAIKKWPFHFEPVEKEERTVWEYRTKELYIDVWRFDSIKPIPAPRLFNEGIAQTRSKKLWVLCQKDKKSGQVKVVDRYNRSVFLSVRDAPLIDELEKGQFFIRACGQQVARSEYKIISLECEDEEVHLNTGSAPPFVMLDHQVRKRLI